MERMSEATGSLAQGQVLEGSYLDWPAILGGAVVAVAVGTVFTAFGAVLGLSLIGPDSGAGRFGVMLIVSAVWIAVSTVASYMTGGYIAGRMRRRLDGASADEVSVRDGLNGLVVWGFGMIVSVILVHGTVMGSLSAAGSVASATGSVVQSAVMVAEDMAGGAAKAAMQPAGSQSGGVLPNPMDYITATFLRPAEVAPAADAQTPAPDYSGDVGLILTSAAITGALSDAERSYLTSAAAAQAGISSTEAAKRLDTALTAAQEMRSKAEAMAVDAKDAAIKAAQIARVSAILAGFFAAATALVAAVAAYSGAVRGGLHRDEGRLFGGFSHSRRA